MGMRGPLTGMLLGDAHISRPPRGNSQLSFNHSTKQAEYAAYKAALVADAGFAVDSWDEWRTLKTTGKSYARVCYRTNRDPLFSAWRTRWYPGGVKTVSMGNLLRLDRVGMAFWFLDDGSVHYSHGMVTALKISTDCFSYSEHELLQKYARETWDLETRIYRRKDKFVLFFPQDSAKKLRDIVLPIAEKVPSMLYKLRIGEQQYPTHERATQHAVGNI